MCKAISKTVSAVSGIFVFDEDRKVRMAYSALADLLLLDTSEGESVMDFYVKKVVMECGTVHQHTLSQIQGESMRRLQFEASEGWLEMLWERVTWHDVILWFMLLTLSKKYGYVTSAGERSMLKAIYDACTKEDGTRFKMMTALLYAK